MASKDLERFLALLPTSEAASGIKLFDDLVKDPANAGPILQELLLVASNHEDPQLHTPHGLLTVRAARDALLLTRPPRGIGLLRFLVLYTFSMPKRKLTPEAAAAVARAVPAGSRDELGQAYVKAVHGGLGAQAAALRRSRAPDARVAPRHLTPAENAWLLWKLYRTLTTRFGYPEFLRLGPPGALDRESVLEALDSSLRHKTPPAETTLRQVLESGVPLEDLLARIVDAYGAWTVGEKDHTISYLNAALQTARFLGKDEALLPLAIALGKLPF